MRLARLLNLASAVPCAAYACAFIWAAAMCGGLPDPGGKPGHYQISRKGDLVGPNGARGPRHVTPVRDEDGARFQAVTSRFGYLLPFVVVWLGTFYVIGMAERRGPWGARP